MNWFRVRGANCEGGLSVRCLQHLIAIAAQDRSDKCPDDLLVLYEQDRLGPDRRIRFTCPFAVLNCAGDTRKKDLKSRSVPGLAINHDVTARLLYDPIDRRQS